MSDASDFVETEIRDWLSQGTDPVTAFSNLYVSLHTADPGDTGTDEVGAGDYSRVSTTTGADWDTPASDQFDNANEITFGVATSNWGTVSHVGIWDASSGGNFLLGTALDASKSIDTDDEARFQAGNLSFTVA